MSSASDLSLAFEGINDSRVSNSFHIDASTIRKDAQGDIQDGAVDIEDLILILDDSPSSINGFSFSKQNSQMPNSIASQQN